MSYSSIGKYIIRLDTVDSTNNYAAILIDKNKPAEGTVIMADNQESGRGQRETTWESEHGKNLLVSFIFYPQIDVADHFFLNQCIALAVYELAEQELHEKVRIKWPNDILVNEKKIAGILIENSIRGNQFLYSIAGIGMNVNQINFKKYSPEATSLAIEKKDEYSLINLLNKLCSCLNKWYQALDDEKYELISSSYANVLYLLDALNWFEVHNEKLKGRIRGVTEEGKLRLEKENGELLKLNFKEVKYLFD